MPSNALAGIRPRNQLFFLLLSLVSCLASIALTVNFCMHLRSDVGAFATSIAVAIGLAWEFAKYAFAPIGVRLLKGERPDTLLAGLGLLAVTILLVLGSICASMGYLLESDADQQRRQVESSRSYKDAQAQIVALDKEIALIQKAADADISRHFRARAMVTLARAEPLRQRRAALNQSLVTLETPGMSVSPFFGGLAAIIAPDVPSGAQSVRLMAYIVVSLMLELISICSVSLVSFSTGSGTVSVSIPNLEPVPHRYDTGLTGRTDFGSGLRTGTPVETAHARWHAARSIQEGRADTGTQSGANTRYKRTRDLIASGKIPPTIRAVRHALNISQEPARRFLRQLCGEGLLIPAGQNRYQVMS